MAFKLIDATWSRPLNGPRYDYLCDTEADVADLPKANPGSSALVVESGAIYMVNASGNWVVFGG